MTLGATWTKERTMTKAQEIKHISETVYEYMQEAYDEGFEAGVKTTQKCSWEKGVRDAWEYITHMVDKYSGEVGVGEMRMIGFLHDLDPVIYTKDYVDSKNREELAKTEPIEVGDVVIGADGKARVVIHISENDFVYAINIKDSSDLLVEIPYLLKKTGEKAVVRIFKPLAVGELK